MAIYVGLECLNCVVNTARPDSHFCSAECKAAFMAECNGPVRCRGGAETICFAETDAVAAAEAAGWTEIEEDPEGVSWNYDGFCPDCQEAPQ